MTDVQIFTPTVIQDNPFPQQGQAIFETTEKPVGGTYSPTTIKEQSMPTKRIAIELLSSVLNTKSKKILGELQFTEHGAIQVGKYVNGVSGDMRISPNGIVARNISGINTFVLDGDTGDATFAGTIQTGAIISGLLYLGNNKIIHDGINGRTVYYDDAGVPQIIIGNA